MNLTSVPDRMQEARGQKATNVAVAPFDASDVEETQRKVRAIAAEIYSLDRLLKTSPDNFRGKEQSLRFLQTELGDLGRRAENLASELDRFLQRRQ